MNNFNFDFGIGSNRPKSLNDQKNPNPSPYSSSKPTWQPNKPSWAHQPAPMARPGGLNGPTSMVGDISGKSWNAGTGSGSGIGIAEKNPSLFGDLVNSAMGNNKGSSNSNVPLKNVNKSAHSMGNLADSLPKTSGFTAKSGGSWGGNGNLGSYSSGYNSSNANVTVDVNKSSNLGGASMKTMSGFGGGMSESKDPFGSLVDFRMNQKPGSLNSASKDNKPSGNAGDDANGGFQNASKSTGKSVLSGRVGAINNDFMGSNTSSRSNIDDLGMFNNNFPTQKPQNPVQPSAGDPLDMFFTPSSGDATTVSGGSGGQPLSEVDDWGLDSGLGGGGVGDSHGATTELEGLPPPPAGVTASAAKNKGMDNQKQGQYADAIKWLSWAVALLEKTGDKASTMEVLSSRASCYKEVGEYKKAVADCSKVLEHDDANVSVLVQRALLYESMEKYRLGAEDLRVVLKIDPANRVARSTIHRLTKMAE